MGEKFGVPIYKTVEETLTLGTGKLAVDVKREAKLKEIVAVSYHTLDAYGYHALEMGQCALWNAARATRQA